MKIITFARNEPPFVKGQQRVVPDDMAARLEKEGIAENLRAFPPEDIAPRVPVRAAAAAPKRAVLRLGRKARR